MNMFAFILDDRSGGPTSVLRVAADDAPMAKALAHYWLTVDGTRDRAMVDLCLHPAIDLGDLAMSEGDMHFLRAVFHAGPFRIVSLPSDLQPVRVVNLPNGLGPDRMVGPRRGEEESLGARGTRSW